MIWLFINYSCINFIEKPINTFLEIDRVITENNKDDLIVLIN